MAFGADMPRELHAYHRPERAAKLRSRGSPSRGDISLTTFFLARRTTDAPQSSLHPSRTRGLNAGVRPSLRFDDKATRVKQHCKLERALRAETTINNSKNFRVGKRLCDLDRLRAIGRNVHHRRLGLECVAQHCALASQTVERAVLPTVDEDNHRAPDLRWGDPRVMALLSAICSFATAPEGLTNRSLRRRVAMLWDTQDQPGTPQAG